MHKALGLACSLVVVFAGCGKKQDEAASTKQTTETPDKPKQPITAALFGKTVAPPGPLAKLTRGMPAAEAEKMLNEANRTNEFEGAHWWMGLAKDGKLDDILLEFPTAQRGLVAQAWGPGQDTDRGGKPVTVWFNPETQTRAALSDDGSHSTLRFEEYTPLGKLLGDGPTIAALSKPIVGLTQPDLAKAYPELADKDGHLWLPATEWEFGSGIPVSPYPMEGTIQSVAFSIPFKKGDDKSKADILDAIEKKWGKVKSVDELDPKDRIYNNEKPRIEVYEDSYSRNVVNIRMSEPKAKGAAKKKK
jgi:hypothetical protein